MWRATAKGECSYASTSTVLLSRSERCSSTNPLRLGHGESYAIGVCIRRYTWNTSSMTRRTETVRFSLGLMFSGLERRFRGRGEINIIVHKQFVSAEEPKFLMLPSAKVKSHLSKEVAWVKHKPQLAVADGDRGRNVEWSRGGGLRVTFMFFHLSSVWFLESWWFGMSGSRAVTRRGGFCLALYLLDGSPLKGKARLPFVCVSLYFSPSAVDLD